MALLDFTRTVDVKSPNNEGGGGNDKWFTTLVRAGLVIGGAVGLYFVYETGQAVEREIVGAIRGWKKAGFPALVNIKTEKVDDKFNLY